MGFKLALRLYGRSWARLGALCACLGLGAATISGLSTILASVEGEASRRAREMLAADVEVRSARPFAASAREVFARLEAEGAAAHDSVSFSTMLSAGQAEPFLVAVKAVPPSYPFYGAVETEPPGALAALGRDGCLLEEAAARQRGLKAGDVVRLGGLTLRLRGLIVREPGRLLGALGLAPGLLVPLEAAKASGLIAFGSRVSYRRLFRLPESSRAAAERAKERLERELRDPYADVTAFTGAEAAAREALQRAGLFFTFAALVALLLASVGTAAGVSIFLEERAGDLALVRCLGVSGAELARLHLALFSALGAGAGAVGALAGWAGAGWGLSYARQWLGLSLEAAPGFSWAAAAEAVGVCLVAAVGAQALRLRALSGLSPSEALRHEAARPAAAVSGPLLGLLAVAVLGVYAWAKTDSVELSRVFALSLGGAAAAVWLLAAAFLRFSSAAGAALAGPVWLRHGLLHLGRQRARAPVFLFMLALGLSLLGALDATRRALTRELEQGSRDRSPDLFLVDVQPSQAAGVLDLAERAAGERPALSPLIRARLAAVGGAPVTARDLAGLSLEERSRQRFLTREYNLTYKDVLQEGERLVAGRFWAAGSDAPEASLEKGFAERLGLKLGDRLTFEVQGRPIETVVTSLRAVEWMSLRPNFFVVLPEAVLRAAPQTLIGSLSAGRERAPDFQRELARRFPNVSVIDLRSVLERVRGLLDALIKGLAALSAFCLALGLAVLAGGVWVAAPARAERARLLRVLGAPRRAVVLAEAAEFAAIGLSCGLIAVLVSAGLSWSLAWRLKLDWLFGWKTVALLAAASLLPIAAGLLADRRALSAQPASLLREE